MQYSVFVYPLKIQKISVVKKMDSRNSKERDVFWEAYRGCAEEKRVGPDRSPFYVKWAKDFARFLPEKSLRDRFRKDIEAFLADLGKRRGIADWQREYLEDQLRRVGKIGIMSPDFALELIEASFSRLEVHE